VVVAHGGTVLAALHVLRPDDDPATWWAKGVPNCSITEFEVTATPDGLMSELVRFGDNTHIPEAKPGW
jgi:broad specificity phosphatase PhoE